MDITTLAAWGEFLGGIAVVVSLVYLASQIRQNSRLLRVSTAATVGEGSTAATNLIAQDPEMARIFGEANVDRAALSGVDQMRFDSMLSQVFSRHCLEYHLSRDEALMPVLWAVRERQFAWAITNSGIQQWWNEWPDIYDADFRNYVDGLIREGEAAG